MPIKSKQEVAERRDTILALSRTGMSPRDIAKKLNLAMRTVQRILSNAGAGGKAGRPAKIVDNKLDELYPAIKAFTLSIDEAASLLNVSTSTLRRRLRQYALQRAATDRKFRIEQGVVDPVTGSDL